MSKPEPIPPHILDMAELEVRRWPLDTNCVPEVARIIMAAEKRGEDREREACADLVFSTPAAIEHPAGPLYGAGWAAAVQLITIAIRKRVEEPRA